MSPPSWTSLPPPSPSHTSIPLFNSRIIFHCVAISHFWLSIHQLMDIRLASTFWLLWIVLLKIFLYKYLFGHLFSVLLDKYLSVKLLDHREILYLTYWGTANLFLHSSILHSHQQCTEIQFLHTLTDISYTWFFDSSGSTSWFWFAFLWWPIILSIFLCAYWPFVCLLWINITSSPVPILNWIICLFVIKFPEFFKLINSFVCARS